ncbi:putative LPS assembly protein LptD [Rufibacter sp. LB8]|uniref:putative LPS assembly protein LptD n=1 Tax=Rufibacter sp. LB8 TaxID=2777781 RepID=UPI00178C3C7E|nr:putative LPS assembly protein LptD [Rufibacter sp. LB8]
MAIPLFFWVAFLSATEGNAQTRPASTDSVKVTVAADSVRRGDIETTINYKAKDSILYDAVNQIMYLYGTAHIDYGEVSLDADFIQINWKTNIIDARGTRDSTGTLQGKPLFKSGEETYQAETMAYNFKTKKGRVLGAVTTQGEGFIHAETIKKNDQNEIYGQHARYTTCNLEHPHFYIKATKMKVMPGDRVVAGPFHLVFADVPTPFGFPFGFFPSPKTRGSGVLIPTFGESMQQGFYLRDGGFYWALNEYMDLRLTGDIFSLGGYGVSVQSNYTKRYKYRGNFSVRHNYNKDPNNFRAGATVREAYRFNNTDSRDIWIQWAHSPVTLPGKGQFSASVNAGSRFANQRNFTTPQQALSTNFTSSISYGKSSPNSPFSYRVSITQNQSVGTNVYRYKDKEGKDQTIQEEVQRMSITLPDMSFGVASQSPIEWFGGTLTGRWIEGIRLGYNLNLRQDVTNAINRSSGIGFPFTTAARTDTILAINSKNLSTIFKNAPLTINHDIPLTLGTINLFKHFKLTPSVNYRESWTTKKFTYSRIPDSNLIKVDTASGLHRVYQYSGGMSLTTNLYGIAQINGKKVQAIRHTITPNISYSYTPDFSRPEFGFYQRVQVDSTGNSRLTSRFPLGTNLPGSGLNSSISFGIQNNVEMKVKTDSAGVFKKVSLIDLFSIQGAYNMAADSFNLSNINVNLSTRLFNTFSFTSSAIFDPYAYVNGLPVNRFLIEDGGFRLARLTNINANFSFEASPKAREQQEKSGMPPPTTSPILQRGPSAADYMDFNIPWTLNVGFTSNFTRDPRLDKLVNNATSLDLNGSVTLTEKWAFNYTTGYDFKNKLLSFTNLAITRDLHCWQMSINWVPIGAYQSYSINISAKSSMLRDLKISRSEYSTGRPWGR